MAKPVLNAVPIWRGLAGVLAACGVALLLGCGPGVGGTGTGSQEALTAFGAAPATLCASPLGASLGCTASPGTASPGSSVALPWLVDSASAARVTAHVSGDDVAFEAHCEGLHFEGRWGAVAGQGERFYGFATLGSVGTPVLATLSLVPQAGGVSTLLQDSQGRVLSGPHLLLAQTTPPPAAACP
jgi:hypothetical protein